MAAGGAASEACSNFGVEAGPYARCGSVKRVTIGVGQAMLVLHVLRSSTHGLLEINCTLFQGRPFQASRIQGWTA